MTFHAFILPQDGLMVLWPDWLWCVKACLHNWKSAWGLPACDVAFSILYFDGLRYCDVVHPVESEAESAFVAKRFSDMGLPFGLPFSCDESRLSPHSLRKGRRRTNVVDPSIHLSSVRVFYLIAHAHRKSMPNLLLTVGLNMNSCVVFEIIFIISF